VTTARHKGNQSAQGSTVLRNVLLAVAAFKYALE